MLVLKQLKRRRQAHRLVSANESINQSVNWFT